MSREFAVFALSDALFALDVSDVREILRSAALSPAPGHSAVEGLLNLRGQVVPVVDVRSRLELPEQDMAVTDYLIVVEAGERTGIVRTSSEVRLTTAVDAAVQPADGTQSEIAATVRLEHEVASLLNATNLLSALEPHGS